MTAQEKMDSRLRGNDWQARFVVLRALPLGERCRTTGKPAFRASRGPKPQEYSVY